MTARPGRGALAGGVLAATSLLACGGPDEDACKGRAETCLSLTLAGGGGVAKVDQLEVLLMRAPRPLNPAMRLPSAQDLPFKVAVLWPDGAAVVSVRSYLNGELNGVTAELSMDLWGGTHSKRALTLFPPLPGKEGDMGIRDMTPPADLRMPADLATPDLSMPDLGTSDLGTSDLALPDLGTSDLALPDLGVSDLGTRDLAAADMALGMPDLGGPDMGAAPDLADLGTLDLGGPMDLASTD